jgi:hypothetical protein
VAAGHSINPARWQAALDELLGRIAGRFTRVEPRRRAGAFVRGLLADLPHKNWTINPVPCARIIWPVTPPRAPERDRALRGHRKWRDTSSGWLIVRRPSSRASGMFGLERLCHGAAAAEAGRDGGERRHHEHGC